MSRDPFDLFAQLEEEHRAERLAKAKAANEAARVAEAKAAAEAKARVDATTQRANVSFRRAEFERAGVAPPFTDGAGNPTTSLSLLLQMGWEIKQLGEDRVLVRPVAFSPGRLQSQV